MEQRVLGNGYQLHVRAGVWPALSSPRAFAAQRMPPLLPLPASPHSAPSQHSSFFYALWAAGAAVAAALLGTAARPAGWGGAAALAACFAVPVAVVLPSSITFMAHIMEKVGQHF